MILDEAQSVKNARSQVAAAVSAVAAKCRWCLSGTPLQNNVDDLFSYFRFLRYEPYGDAASFRTLIKEPIRVDPAAGFRRLQAILRAVMLRRTKQSRINGEPIVRLPPRTVVHSRRVFLPAEQKAYARLQAEYRGKMEEFAAAGTVSSNYVNLLHMLLRLRQACNHPSLVGGVRAAETDATSISNRPERADTPIRKNDTDTRVSVPTGARVAVPASAAGGGAAPAGGAARDDARRGGARPLRVLHLRRPAVRPHRRIVLRAPLLRGLRLAARLRAARRRRRRRREEGEGCFGKQSRRRTDSPPTASRAPPAGRR